MKYLLGLLLVVARFFSQVVSAAELYCPQLSQQLS